MYQFSFTKSEFEIFPQLPPGPGIPSTTPHRSVRRTYRHRTIDRRAETLSQKAPRAGPPGLSEQF